MFRLLKPPDPLREVDDLIALDREVALLSGALKALVGRAEAAAAYLRKPGANANLGRARLAQLRLRKSATLARLRQARRVAEALVLDDSAP